MTFKMLWYREVMMDESNDPELTPVIKECEMGFDNEIHYIEKNHFWQKAEKHVLHSDVPISDYIMGRGDIVTLLMKETWDGKLIPIVTKDRAILKGIGPILSRFTREKDNEIEMLKNSLESLQQSYTQQLIAYHEHYQRMYQAFNSIVPLLLKIMHQRFDTIRQFVRKDFSEHDFKVLLGRMARDVELTLLDEFKQDVLDVKYTKATPPFIGGKTAQLPAPRPKSRQKAPRKKRKPPPQEESANPFAGKKQELPPMLPSMEAYAEKRNAQKEGGAQQPSAEKPKKARGSKEDITDLIEAVNSGNISFEGGWEDSDE